MLCPSGFCVCSVDFGVQQCMQERKAQGLDGDKVALSLIQHSVSLSG